MQAFFVRLARNRETVDMKERIDLVSPKILHCSGSVMWQMYVGFCSELSYPQSFWTLNTANRDLTFVVAQMATKSKT